jgi:hypothetical protein
MKNILSIILILFFVGLQTNVTATGDHDPAKRPINCAKFMHDPLLVKFCLDEEDYINDIPFNTEKEFQKICCDYDFTGTDYIHFTLDDEDYIDDIPWEQEEIIFDSVIDENTPKEEDYMITPFILEEEDYINDIPWETRQAFAKKIKYPEEAKNCNLEGMVIVSFSYDEDGYIVVNGVNASCNLLKDFIVNQIENMRLTKGIVSVGAEYLARFDFKIY